MKTATLTAFIALALILPTAWDTNHDSETDQATADTVLDRAAESAQLQVDVLFAEASRPGPSTPPAPAAPASAAALNRTAASRRTKTPLTSSWVRCCCACWASWRSH